MPEQPLLELKQVRSGYGFLEVLHGVSLVIPQGAFVALLGPNGAGKTTLLRTIVGVVRPTAGTIVFEGTPIQGMPIHTLRRQGVALVSETLNLFPGMTVYENLQLGGYVLKDKHERQQALEFVEELLPRLRERRSQFAGSLSGGERKMLGIGRALMGSPRLLMVDELSLGLAPRVTLALFETLRKLSAGGLSILLVEQNVQHALAVADRGYVLELGNMVLSGPSADLSASPRIQSAYLGVI